MKIPSMLLRRLYTTGSLTNGRTGVRFGIKNRLSDATLTRISGVRLNGGEIPLDLLTVDAGRGRRLKASEIDSDHPLHFPLRQELCIEADRTSLPEGEHEIALSFETRPFGALSFSVTDALSSGEKVDEGVAIPYDKHEDYTPEMIERRRRFVEEYSGAKLKHTSAFSFDPLGVRGNIENFTGVAQVPIGFAGPMQVNGEHAQGEFLVPLATTEGTLVASYNRGMKVMNLCGGVTCTVLDDRMQRAPVFIFDSAREAREFKSWVERHQEPIREVAEKTSSVAKLAEIESYLANKFVFMRFNFSTGDAAGQNMVSKAAFAACNWILEHTDTVRRFYLESNLAGDKKGTHVNILHTRGKRVVAEITVQRKVLRHVMRAEPESLFYHYNVANVGAFLAGSNNNGAHSPNAITAIFIATGQDVASLAESSSALIYSELTTQGDLHISLTIPSLTVATYGGGTGLATQSECLAAMGCLGRDKVNKFAEIVAGAALAGEISLAASISSLEWVASHEKHGRNR